MTAGSAFSRRLLSAIRRHVQTSSSVDLQVHMMFLGKKRDFLFLPSSRSIRCFSSSPSMRADRVLPAELPISWRPDKPVLLTMTPEGPGSREPLLVQSMMRRTVEQWPDRHALVIKRDGKWVHWTYKEYQEKCRAVAKGFLKLGLERFEGVGILG